MQKIEAGTRPKTLEDIRRLKPDDVNNYWVDIKYIIESAAKGKPPREAMEPETLEDLRGLTVDEVTKYWPKVVEILEGSATK